MLSENLTRLGRTIESFRFSPNGGVDFTGPEIDQILATIYTAAEDAAALEAAAAREPSAA